MKKYISSKVVRVNPFGIEDRVIIETVHYDGTTPIKMKKCCVVEDDGTTWTYIEWFRSNGPTKRIGPIVFGGWEKIAEYKVR